MRTVPALRILSLATLCLSLWGGGARAQLAEGPERTALLNDANDLYDRAVALRVKQPHDAIPLFERAISLLERALGPRRPIPRIRHSLAVTYERVGELAKATAVLRHTSTLMENDAQSQASDMATVLTSLGRVLDAAGDLPNAEAVLEKAVARCEKAYGADSHEGADAGFLLALVKRKRGDVRAAERLFKKVIAILERANRHDDSHLALAANELGMIAADRAEYAIAEGHHRRAIAIYEKQFGARAWMLAGPLSGLGNIHLRRAEWAEAETSFERALALAAAAWGRESRMAATLIDNLGRLYMLKGELRRSEDALRKSLALRQRVHKAPHLEIAQTLNNLALTLLLKGDLAESESLFERSVEMAEQTMAPHDPELGVLLGNIALNYSLVAKFGKAEKLFARSLTILRNAFGAEHPGIARTLTNLAQMNLLRGQIRDAEGQAQAAMNILRKTVGREDLLYGFALSMYGEIVAAKGDPGSALGALDAALEVFAKAFGDNSLAAADALRVTGVAYRDLGDYESARRAIVRALEIQKKLRPSNPIVGFLSGLLATILAELGKTTDAVELFESGIRALEKAYGPNHHGVAELLGAQAKAELGSPHANHGTIRNRLKRALAIQEKVFGPTHPRVGISLSNLALLEYQDKKVAKARAWLVRANQAIDREIEDVVALGSTRQKQMFMERFFGMTSFTVSLHLHAQPKNARAAELALTTILRRKGRVLDALIEGEATTRNRLGESAVPLVRQLAALRAERSSLSLRGTETVNETALGARLSAVTVEIEKIEEALGYLSSFVRAKRLPVTIDGVRSALPDGAALVEFIAYQRIDPKRRHAREAAREIRYAAYLVTKGTLRWADLGDAAPIEELVKKWRTEIVACERAEARCGEKEWAESEKRTNELARALDAKVMAPVRAHLGKTKRLILSPDGLLHLVPFEALADEKGRYVVATNAVSYVTSGRDLLRPRVATKATAPVVIADPDFEGVSDEEPKATTRSGDLASVKWSRLPATLEEAKAVAPLLKAKARVLSGKDAAESAVKSIERPSILHIATHGFFLGSDSGGSTASRGIKIVAKKPSAQETPAEASAKNVKAPLPEDPLIQSGLVFAGANRGASSGDDGFLTALEASGLNLDGTKLVVLSACETGVGSVERGEGVHGLRRALVLAGAETLVMSLWKVDDEATRDLMTAFYKALASGAGRAEALDRARRDMLSRTGRSHPYYWASFIALGDANPL